MGYPFYIVDVFAETKYAGNQLAVIRNAAALSNLEMQKIAKEMNYSETTFILGDNKKDDGFDVRIFSLDEELPFAGHPTLGTAFIIQQVMLAKQVPQVKLNLKIGQITVSIYYQNNIPDLLWMKQVAPTFGRTFNAADVAGVLNINEDQIDKRFPIEEVSTGLPFILVPLKNLDAVRSCTIDRLKFFKLVGQAEAKSLFVFCPETYNTANDLNARMFDDYHGLPEDPATGSANGCLAAYLVKNRYFGTSGIEVKVEQGYEIGRPSLLMLKAEQKKEGDVIDVSVGGRVIMIAHGELL